MSLTEIYNRAIVTGQTPAGAPVRASRTAGQQSGVMLEVVSSPSLANPSFEVDTSSWTAGGGTLTRTTVAGEFSSGVAGGKFVVSGSGTPVITSPFTGMFVAGRTYVLTFSMRSFGGLIGATVNFGDAASGDVATVGLAVLTAFRDYAVAWTPTAARTNATISLSFVVGTYYVDDFKLSGAKPTLVDRRGFRRTKQVPISAALPSDLALANSIGDTWLTGHKSTPSRGTATVKRGAIREALTGRTMELEELGLHVGELVRFTDRVDPDTGGWGRSMRLIGVKLDNANDEAILTFDNSRADFETLMNRMDLGAGSS